jgi:hypothetical protein
MGRNVDLTGRSLLLLLIRLAGLALVACSKSPDETGAGPRSAGELVALAIDTVTATDTLHDHPGRSGRWTIKLGPDVNVSKLMKGETSWCATRTLSRSTWRSRRISR